MKRFVLFMIVLGAINNPLGLPLYFRSFALLGGMLFFYTKLRVSTNFILPYLLVLLGLVGSFYHLLWGEVQLRLLQVFLMICIAHFISKQKVELLPKFIVNILLPITAFVLLVEVVFIDTVSFRSIVGITVPRFSGIHGHHNYNAMLCGFLGVTLLTAARYGAASVFFLAAICSGSRGFIVAAISALFIFVFKKTRLFSLFFLDICSERVALAFPFADHRQHFSRGNSEAASFDLL